MKEFISMHVPAIYGEIGLTGFWSFFQQNAKYVIFAAGIFFAAKEWKNKAIGKMIGAIIIAAILFILTLKPETLLQPLGQKLFQMIGAN